MAYIARGRIADYTDNVLSGSANHEPHYDELLVGATRPGGASRPDLRANRPVVRLFRNGIVHRPRGKIAAPCDVGNKQFAAHSRDGGGNRARRSSGTAADPWPRRDHAAGACGTTFRRVAGPHLRATRGVPRRRFPSLLARPRP